MSSRLLNRREFAGVACALSAAASSAQVSGAAPQPGVLDRVHLGAQYFLNRSDTPEKTAMHFRRMADTGLTVARIFTIWDHVEPQQGEWDFVGYDAIYDAAQKNGILIANTLCAEDPPGWMGTAPFYHQWQDLANPQLRPHSERYIEKVVTRYRHHPAHGVWLLQNEPGLRGGTQPFLLPLFARWLERKYGTVEALNKSWYRRLKRFEDVPFPVDARTALWPDYPSLLDWRYFWCDHLADQQRWIRAEVYKYHPGSLTHINPPGLTANMPASGRDLWKLKPTVHFLGASMHAAWSFGAFARDEFGVAYGFCCDLIRSASAPAPYWVTELQAGPTILTGSRPLNPTAGEITRWLWDGIGNGSRGIIFWLWHPRTEGNEAGEWGLAGPSGEPTPRTEATKAIARVLRKHEPFFSEAKPEPARSAILYSRETLILHAVESWRRTSAEEAVHSLIGCYKALHRAHVAVDFIGTDDLESGAASRYRVIYLPFAYALSDGCVAALRQFVADGGTLWADGLVGWKNEKGETLSLPPGRLSDVFGFTLTDVDAQWEPFEFAKDGGATGELWRFPMALGTARPVLLTPDGAPAAVENRFGKGRALYFGTALTLAAQRRKLPQAEKWITAPAEQAAADAVVRLFGAPAEVSCRVMRAGQRYGVFLNNWGGAAQVGLRVGSGIRRVTDLLTGSPVRMSGESAVEFSLGAGGSAVLLME